eukprot:11004660-Ditylum_brightwellii.AAC.1
MLVLQRLSRIYDIGRRSNTHLTHYDMWLKENRGGAVKHIKVPDKITNNLAMYDEVLRSLQYEPLWKEIDDEDKVMSSLLLHNKLHLHQARVTPFANGPLKDYLGTDILGKGAQDIFND